MFSATLGQEVQSWCKLHLDNLVSLRVGAANAATDTIDQKLLYCGNEHGKLVAFRALVLKVGVYKVPIQLDILPNPNIFFPEISFQLMFFLTVS